MSESNWWRRVEAKIKPIYLVGLFLLLLLFAFWKEGRAEVSAEIGPTFASGEFSDGGALILSERFGDYEIGIGYLSEQRVVPRDEVETEVMENIVFQASRMVGLTESIELGIGVSMFNAESRTLGSKFNFSLTLRWVITDRWYANVRHWSNAGSVRPNMGQDAIMIGYRF